MHPIYFPYTYISQYTAQKLCAFFQKTVVYQVMKNPDQASFDGIEFQYPFSGDEENIQKALSEYKTWALQHQGSTLSFFKTRMADVPFYSETSISNIRRDIKKRIKNKDLASPEPDDTPEAALFAARLFLAIAHEHDAYQTQIQADLNALSTMEKTIV